MYMDMSVPRLGSHKRLLRQKLIYIHYVYMYILYKYMCVYEYMHTYVYVYMNMSVPRLGSHERLLRQEHLEDI